MSETKWTPAQARAITHRGGSLLVGAAAGSGKTSVLVERAMGLLTDPVTPISADRLLVVTFTNAAAAELRGRLLNRLTAEIAANPGRSELARQRVRLQRASIGTIDSFCLALLQREFSRLGIPPDFTTADESDRLRLREQTLTEVLERAYADPDFCAFADLYGRGRSDNAAGETVLRLYDFLRSLPHPKATLDQFCRDWESDCPMEETGWCRALLKKGEEKAATALSLARRGLDLCRETATGGEKYAEVFNLDAADLEGLCAAMASPDSRWDDIRIRLEGWEWKRLPSVRGGKDAAAEMALDLREEYKKILKEMGEEIFLCTAAEFEEDRHRAAPLVRALARAVLDFDECYFAAKLEEKLLEFSDFEHLTLQLLEHEDGTPTPDAARIAGGYDVVMVDEFQDTNTLQDAIYRRLAKPDGSNLFLVGDLKQSIYRFRQADPAVFLSKQDAWAALDPGEAPQPAPCPPRTLALDANFRSSPAVVEGANYFFHRFMSRELGGVDYGPGQELVQGASMPPLPDGMPYRGFCELAVVETDSPEGEAAAIADRICRMKKEGQLVRDRKSGELRPCEYGDFCILLRGRKHFAVFTAALEGAGIPVCADSNENLLDTPQVRPFAALLRVLDNPAQDVELAAVMLSPVFGFTPDDLIALRTETPKGSLYGAVVNSALPEIRAFYEQLSALRRLADSLPLPQLLEELLAQTGYLAAVGAMPGGETRREELQSFVSWASSTGKSGLSALVRRMDAAQRTGGLTKSAGQVKPDCAAIMTVHHSKGLEFPVVFVSATNTKFNLTDLTRPVLFEAELGLGLNLRTGQGRGIYPTLAHRAVRGKLKADSLSEEMRILYVALTRARDCLILTVPAKDPGRTLEKLAVAAVSPEAWKNAMSTALSPAEWLLSAALVHPMAGKLRGLAGTLLEPVEDSSEITVSLVTPPEIEERQMMRSGLPTAQPDLPLLEQLRESFGWEYPRDLLRRVPVKVSVTSVVHRVEGAVLERPAFLYKEGLTGAERGTATHSFLQSADLSAAAQNLRGEADRQLALEILSPDTARHLDWGALESFFRSPLYGRFCEAKQVLREYAFITSLPARFVMEDKNADYGGAMTLVQGVADAVLLFSDHAEIVDYKTDRGRTAEQILESYGRQLRLYQYALSHRLPVPVTRCTLYSLTLRQEIDVPLPAVPEI